MLTIRCLEQRRSRGWLTVSTCAVVFTAWLQPATAHHSFAPALTEDGEELIEIFEGSIEIYRLLNPHTALIVNATNESGLVEDWLVELSSLASLVREGWTDDSLSAGDTVTMAVLRSHAPYRGRLRAVLVHGATEDDAGRLLVAYGIRGDTPIMRRLQERLPVCGNIDPRLGRTQCFLVDAQSLLALEAEFPGEMGYVMP
ncbi:MAG: DUF6152 family protein [Gammaproteobacteria bacterium]|jgi:hypothetical protein